MRDALDEATRRVEEDESVGNFVVRRNAQQQEQIPSCRSPLVERVLSLLSPPRHSVREVGVASINSMIQFRTL